MNGSNASPVPRPTPSALGLCATAAAAALVGLARTEPALLLVGAGGLALAAYSFLGVLIAAPSAIRAAKTFSCRILPREGSQGASATLFPATDFPRKILLLPGILLRYELDLRTRDGRRLYQTFDPYQPSVAGLSVPTPGRGAYFGRQDHLRWYDAFGLFVLRSAVPAETPARLLVRPRAREELRNTDLRAGGSSQRIEPSYRRTEDLTEHRPYAPGDDPRRINWKLYGHSGDLFVREGENEPPPRSRTTILVDPTADGRIYDEEEARRAVDALAELALGLVVESAAQGRAVHLGYTGSSLLPADPPTAARLLAYPAALSPKDDSDLPLPEDNRGIVLLALPRGENIPGALDRCLTACRGASLELRFIYGDQRTAAEAESCIRRYGGTGGVHADRIQI